MTTAFQDWLNQSDVPRYFLVELTALKIADLSTVALYLSNRPVHFADKQFIPCVSGLPSLDRAANDTLDPAALPTWGELELDIEPDYIPDAERTVAWNLLLYKESYTFMGQPLVIKMGGNGWDYTDFVTVFTGRVAKADWDAETVSLTIYDKVQDLEKKAPDFEFGESTRVDEDSWDQSVPLALGNVKNYKPVLMQSGLAGAYPYKYSLACHVMQGDVAGTSLPAVYFNGLGVFSPASWLFNKRDISPARPTAPDTQGSAILDTYGPYTGALFRGQWRIIIKSITALNSQGASGPEVGLALFDWYLNGVLMGENLLTWHLEPDTVTKLPAAGNATMTLGGDYSGDCKLSYQIKIVRGQVAANDPGGHIGDIPCSQFKWSDDGGGTWNPFFDYWTPVASAPGVMSVVAYNPTDSVLVEITTGGNVGGAVRFKWSNDGGSTWNLDNQIPDTTAIELFAGFSVQFTAPGEAGIDDYDLGDAGGGSYAYDILQGTIIPVIAGHSDPIPLDRGMTAAFVGAAGTGVTTYVISSSWTPVGTAPGDIVWISNNDDDHVEVKIQVAGNIGAVNGRAQVYFQWTKDGGTTWIGGIPILDTNPIELVDAILAPGFSGFFVSFTGPGTALYDDFDVDDDGLFDSDPEYVAPFVPNDIWSWTFKEVPIPLADGVAIQFVKGVIQIPPIDDFYLWDEWTFILMSTLSVVAVVDSTDITVDALGLISPVTNLYASTIGGIIQALCVLFADWPEANIDAAALAVFETAFPATVGLVVDSPSEISSIITDLLAGIPSLYTITRDGIFRIQEIVTPAGTPNLILKNVEVFDSPAASNLPDSLYRRVYLHYDRNHNTEKKAEGVTQDRMEWLRKEFRQISWRDEKVLLTYPMAKDLGPLDTCLAVRTDASALALKLGNLYKVQHESVEVVCGLQGVGIDVGDLVSLVWDEFGRDSGLLYLVTGISLDFTSGESTLTLWR